ncbi:MAG: hypothetical protein ACYDCL_21415 [Myxococcales bacterium]
MSYVHDTPANVGLLAFLFGFEPIVAQSWLMAEAQAIDNPSNPLNIERGGVTASLQTGSVGAFAVFADPATGLRAAHLIPSRLAPAYGYGAVLAQAGSHNPLAQARSIELSGWAAGNYGGTTTIDGTIRRLVRAALAAQGGHSMLRFAIARFHAPQGAPIYDAPAGNQLGAYHAGYDVTAIDATDDGAWVGVVTTTGGVERIVYVPAADLTAPLVVPPPGWADELHGELRNGTLVVDQATVDPAPVTPAAPAAPAPASFAPIVPVDMSGRSTQSLDYLQQLFVIEADPSIVPTLVGWPSEATDPAVRPTEIVQRTIDIVGGGAYYVPDPLLSAGQIRYAESIATATEASQNYEPAYLAALGRAAAAVAGLPDSAPLPWTDRANAPVSVIPQGSFGLAAVSAPYGL